nr:immunoglobulin heavy chain junction region [Mus musculus]
CARPWYIGGMDYW